MRWGGTPATEPPGCAVTAQASLRLPSFPIPWETQTRKAPLQNAAALWGCLDTHRTEQCLLSDTDTREVRTEAFGALGAPGWLKSVKRLTLDPSSGLGLRVVSSRPALSDWGVAVSVPRVPEPRESHVVNTAPGEHKGL